MTDQIKQGIVSFSYDPDTKASIGADFISEIAHLSPAPHHLLIRFPISCAQTDNSLDIEAFRKIFIAHTLRDFTCIPVLHLGIQQSYTQTTDYLQQQENSPNYALGLNGDPFLNRYIHDYSNRCVNLFMSLGVDSPDTVFLGNEPNLAAQLAIGLNCPPNLHLKPSSMAPEVFASMLYVTGTALKRLTPVQTVYPGALSCLIKFNTDPAGTWVGKYLEKGFDYLQKNKAVNWQKSFDGISLNVEGYLTEDFCARAAKAMRDIQKKYGLIGPLVIGEWGIREDSLDMPRMKETFSAMNKYFDGPRFFFQMPTYAPYAKDGYGCSTWTIDASNELVPLERTNWFVFLEEEYKNYFIPGG